MAGCGALLGGILAGDELQGSRGRFAVRRSEARAGVAIDVRCTLRFIAKEQARWKLVVEKAQIKPG